MKIALTESQIRKVLESSGDLEKRKANFIKKAKSLHTDENGNPLYNYDDIDYVDADTLVTLKCPKHGKFPITPDNHLYRLQGCRKCGNIRSGQKRLKGKDKFIRQAQEKFKDDYGNPLYNYNKVNYINSKLPVVITCPKHGDFEKEPDKHLNQNAGCHDCYLDKKRMEKNINRNSEIKQLRKELSIKYPDYDFLDAEFDKSNNLYYGAVLVKKVFCKVKDKDGNLHGYFPKNDKFMRVDRLTDTSCPKCAGGQRARRWNKYL